MSDPVEAVALILRRARGCSAPLEDDGALPCPFCLYPWDEEHGDQTETGCIFIAREILQAVPGWRPIETAPKDGTKLWGYCRNGRQMEVWWHLNFPQPEYWTDEADSEPEPTHWMPLPEGPR